MAAPTDDVSARYGRPTRSRRRAALAVVAVLVILAAGGFTRLAVAVSDRDVRWRDIGFRLASAEEVALTFEVYAAPGSFVRCQARATGAAYADVGQVDVDLGPLADGGEQHTVTIRTVAQADSASIRTCVLRSERLG